MTQLAKFACDTAAAAAASSSRSSVLLKATDTSAWTRPARGVKTRQADNGELYLADMPANVEGASISAAAQFRQQTKPGHRHRGTPSPNPTACSLERNALNFVYAAH